jgi:hypothetical protein
MFHHDVSMCLLLTEERVVILIVHSAGCMQSFLSPVFHCIASPVQGVTTSKGLTAPDPFTALEARLKEKAKANEK